MGFCNVWRAVFLVSIVSLVIIIGGVSISGLAYRVVREWNAVPDASPFLDGMGVAKDAVFDDLGNRAEILTWMSPVAQCYLSFATLPVFDAVPLQQAYQLESPNNAQVVQGCGVMTVTNADIEGNYADDDLGNKISFELTNGTVVSPACPDLLICFTDTSDEYQCYCYDTSTSDVDYSRGIKYNGTDYGLTTEERALYLGQTSPYTGVITAVFDLVGLATVDIELASRCIASAPAAYAITFAQTNLLLFSDQFDTEFTDNLGTNGVAFTVDSKQGMMLACSKPGQVVNESRTAWGTVAQTQKSPYNSTDSLVLRTARLLSSMYHNDTWAPSVLSEIQASESKNVTIDGDGILISIRAYNYGGYNVAPINWLDIVVLDKADFDAKTNGRIRNYGGRIFVIVMALLVIVALSFIYVWRDARQTELLTRRPEHLPLE